MSNGIYIDRSSKGDGRRHESYRAEVNIDGKRIRKRFYTYDEARAWYDANKGKKEEWRIVEGTDGLYQVSNMGRVSRVGKFGRRIINPSSAR